MVGYTCSSPRSVNTRGEIIRSDAVAYCPLVRNPVLLNTAPPDEAAKVITPVAAVVVMSSENPNGRLFGMVIVMSDAPVYRTERPFHELSSVKLPPE